MATLVFETLVEEITDHLARRGVRLVDVTREYSARDYEYRFRAAVAVDDWSWGESVGDGVLGESRRRYNTRDATVSELRISARELAAAGDTPEFLIRTLDSWVDDLLRGTPVERATAALRVPKRYDTPKPMPPPPTPEPEPEAPPMVVKRELDL